MIFQTPRALKTFCTETGCADVLAPVIVVLVHIQQAKGTGTDACETNFAQLENLVMTSHHLSTLRVMTVSSARHPYGSTKKETQSSQMTMFREQTHGALVIML